MPITDVFKTKNNFTQWQVRGGKFTLACNNLNEVQFAKAWLIYNYDFDESEIEILQATNKRGVTEFRTIDEYVIANYERKNPEPTEEDSADSETTEQEDQSEMAQALRQKLDEKRRIKNEQQNNKENNSN